MSTTVFLSPRAPAWTTPCLDHVISPLAKQYIDSKTESSTAEELEGRFDTKMLSALKLADTRN
jgi:hypothetical protein